MVKFVFEKLEKRLKELGKIAVAFSGGIDSSFLLFSANEVLGKENVLAIIGNGQMIPRKDYKEAIEFLKENDFEFKEIPVDCLEVLEFRENHKDRCYYCKKSIMTRIKQVAKENGFDIVCDGKNVDDTKGYRPGQKATKELGIVSPLEECGFTKKDIRENAKSLGITFWDKPSNSCLATRFPYNTELTNESLKRVELAEELIKKLGIPTTRVRCHGDIARIEVQKEYFDRILGNDKLVNDIKELGFEYVTLDLEGMKSGRFDKK